MDRFSASTHQFRPRILPRPPARMRQLSPRKPLPRFTKSKIHMITIIAKINKSIQKIASAQSAEEVFQSIIEEGKILTKAAHGEICLPGKEKTLQKINKKKEIIILCHKEFTNIFPN